MNRLVYILLFMLMAATVSCHRTSEVEARLIAIDSLIPEAPDSALALLEAIDTASLRGEMRAYHALLTAQALYKAYIPATSDSLINRAWDYYKDHGSYDRRIRAMLYKGTTAEETGHPEEAMRWYKRTELESRPDDHYHRGYALMAIGTLYQTAFDIKDAIRNYRQAVSSIDTLIEGISIFCTQRLAQLYLDEKQDSAIFYINKVSEYVQASNDSIYMLYNMVNKSMMWFYAEQYDSAKNIDLRTIELFNSSAPYTCWYHLIMSYSKLGALDSAEYYLSSMPSPATIKDSIYYYEIHQMLNQSRGKWDEALKCEKQRNNISDLLLINENCNSLLQAENQAMTENINKSIPIPILVLIAFCLLAIIIVIAFLIARIKRVRIEKNAQEQISWLNSQFDEARSIIEGLQNENESLLNHVDIMQSELDNQQLENAKLKSIQSDSEMMKLVNVQFKVAFQNCIQRLGDIAKEYYEHGDKATYFIVRFKEEFDACWNSQDFWNAMENYINSSRDNTINKIKNAHSNITISELHLIMLIILNFDPMAIVICMGYKNASVLYTMKNKLKRKLKIKYKTLEDYLESFSKYQTLN